MITDPKDEDLFWEKGLLRYDPLKVLQRTLFFYIDLNFVLRGTQEQYDLTHCPSFKECQPIDETVYYEYTEYISKNNHH